QAGRGGGLVMGDYLLLAEIGAGGMGKVYKAQHRRMKRVVALKVMSSAAMQDDAAVKRFQREVEAAARLEHPNIVTAYDSGEAGKVKYLVMQFVDGGDLSDFVKKSGAMPIEAAVGYLIQAAKGLAFAHAAGVVHRDIKPANLLLDKKGVVKILDMGLARIEDGDGLTATEQVMGTVDYMSPEQAAETKNADGRSDIYSLGCTLWYLLTAKKLYDGDTMISRLMKHRDAELPSLVKTRDDATWPLEQVLHKMIAKRPQDRYQSMDEVVAALEPFAGGGGNATGGGMGSSIGGGKAQSAELASFMQAMAGGKSAEAAKTAGSSASIAAKPATSTAVDATAAFSASEIGTDPKSQLHTRALPAIGAATAGAAKTQGKAVRKKSPPVKLIAGGLLGAAVLIAGIIVTIKNKDGEVVAELNAPAGASVTVTTTPAVSNLPAPPPPGAASSPAVAPPVAPPVPGDYVLKLTGWVKESGAAWVDVPSLLIPDVGPLTLEAYVTALGHNEGDVLGARSLRLGISGGKWAGWLNDDERTRFGMDPIEYHRRHHVALVRDTTEYRLYVNGRKIIARPIAKPDGPQPAAGASPLRIGGDSSQLRLDEIRVSQVARYNQDFTPAARFTPDAETLALYHCDEGTGATLKDSSGRGHDGKITKPQWTRSDGSPVPLAAATSATSWKPAGPALSGLQLAALLDSPDYEWTAPEILPGANSPDSERLSGISADERTLYFVRGQSDFLVSGRADVGVLFSPAEPLPSSVQFDVSRADAAMSADGLTCAWAQTSPRRHILWSERRSTTDPFGETHEFPQSGLLGVGHVAISPDGLTVLATVGGGDVYMWTRPALGKPFENNLRMPSPVSSPEWDMPCYVSDDRLLLIIMSQVGVDGRMRRQVRYFSRPAVDAEFAAGKLLGVPLGPAEGNDGNTGFYPSSDGQRLYFCTSLLPGGVGDKDIWVSHRVPKSSTHPTAEPGPSAAPKSNTLSIAELLDSPDYEWTAPENLGPTINGPGGEDNASLTGDLLRIVYRRKVGPGDTQFELCEAVRSTPNEPFGPPRVVSNLKGFHSYLAADGLTLVKAEQGPEKNDDLYLLRRATLGEPFGAAMELGPLANSPGDENMPTLSPDGLTLVFSSKRPSATNSDLWISRRKSQAESFGPAENVGPPVNSPDDENKGLLLADNRTLVFHRKNTWHMTFTNSAGISGTLPLLAHPFGDTTNVWLAPDGRTAYFSANLPGGLGGQDIYVTRRVPKNGPSPLPRPNLVVSNPEAYGPTAPPPAVFPFDARTAVNHQEAWAKHLGVPVEFTNDVGMKFRLIPPGEFQMGLGPEFTDEELKRLTSEKNDPIQKRLRSSRPAHPVRITRPFYMEVEEVTVGRYRDVVGQLRPEMETDPGKSLANYVTFADAITFCNKLSEREKKRPAYRMEGEQITLIDDADGYRLPTEAQWEYACRAGTNTFWYFGNDGGGVELTSDGDREFRRRCLAPNPFGLSALYAGSNEWCWDGTISAYEMPYSSAILSRRDDPREDVGPHRIKRGGANSDGGGAARRAINSFVRNSSPATEADGGLTSYSGLGRVVLPIIGPDPATSARASTESVSQSPAAGVVYLDDLPEVEFRVFANQGLGKHGKFREQAGVEKKILFRGKPTTHTLWMHPTQFSPAIAFARYQLDGRFATFAAEAGIPDGEIDPQSPIEFRVLGDGRELWKSPALTKRGESAEVSVNIQGVKELRLEVSRGAKNGNCHAVWLMPRLTPVGVPPAITPPADALSQIDRLLSDDYEWSAPESLGPAVNGANWNSSPALSDDQLCLIVLQGFGEGDKRTGLYEYRRQAVTEPWSVVKQLSDSNEDYPSLDPAGLILYSKTEGPKRSDGKTNRQLAVRSRTSRDANWGPATPLATLNTLEAEDRPVISPDGLTLVFSSSRPGGLGMLDLWIARRADLQAEWETPVSLGNSVNSAKDEQATQILGDSKTILFSRAGELFLAEPDARGVYDLRPVTLPPSLKTKKCWLSPDGATLYFDVKRDSDDDENSVSLIRRVPKARAAETIDRRVAERLLALNFPLKLSVAGKKLKAKPGSPLPAEPLVVTGIDGGAWYPVPPAELATLMSDFRRLTNVNNTNLPTKDCDLWAEAFASMPSIMAVNASRCDELTDVGAAHLARLPKLEYANISSSAKITRVGLAAFEKCKTLTTIELCEQAVADGRYVLADIQKLQDALPKTRIVFGGVKPIPGLKPAGAK
ncbi:MAG: protein kinase, partial [Planctomycetales bacterium]|nr:protein kinase [Planctomycetales bacterium]